MKVVLLADLPLDLEKINGGVQSAVLNLLYGFNYIDELWVDVIVFNSKIKTQKKIVFLDNITIYFIPIKYPIIIIDYFLNRKALFTLIRRLNPDIIHIQAAAPHLFRFAFVNKKNIVITQHGIMQKETRFVKTFTGRIKYFVKIFVEKFYYPRFKNLIFISNYNLNLFKSTHNMNKYNFDKIYNAVNIQFFENEKKTKKIEKELVYVGVINKRKNLEILLKTYTIPIIYNKYKFLNIIGGFLDIKYENKIKSFIENNNLSNKVRFWGWLTQKQLLQFYKKKYIFVLPSLQETLPVSIAEALSKGQIVIARSVGGINEMIINGFNGFLFNKDNELVKILENLDLSSNQILRISENAVKTAKINYNPLDVAKRTYKFYQNVLKDIEIDKI